MRPPTSLSLAPFPPDMPHTDAIVIMTTLASADDAVKLVQTLLERRLIACGPGKGGAGRCDGRTCRQLGRVPIITRTGA